jgi:hypothetical protein
MLSVIGIHSKIDDRGRISLTSGHAWLTLHFPNGRFDSVGLWPDKSDPVLRLLVRDPVGLSKVTEEKFRVQWDNEIRVHYKSFASRYYGLRQGEQTKAIHALGLFTGWRLTNNCTTWATNQIKEIFGVKLFHSEYLGMIDTPRALGSTLMRLEAKCQSAVGSPIYP